MKVVSVQAFAVRLPRPPNRALGTAGSPTPLLPTTSGYSWSTAVPALYSTHFETALVKVVCEDGLVGWGEAQAPLAPEVACTIVNLLLKPVLEGSGFSGTVDEIREFWWRMYRTMRVRGQTGGFMLDAISGVDIALWDLAGKMRGEPVSRLITAGVGCRSKVPAYLSGVSGNTPKARVACALDAANAGFRLFKIFFDCPSREFFESLRELRSALGADALLAVDALWRLDPESAPGFGEQCDSLDVFWLEAPLMPEDPREHARLAARIRTPLALGESYRTVFELRPFIESGAVRFVQPDLGRCGITEGLRIAQLARENGKTIAPHLSIAMGPQIAAAIHFAASVSECEWLEYNPNVLEIANGFLSEPLQIQEACYKVPQKPGLGIEVCEDALRSAIVPS